MALLLNLYLGHLMGDFVLQPGRLVAAKREGLLGLLIHVGVIGAGTAVILFADLAAVWNLVLLATAAHLAIEVITIKARNSGALSGLSVFIIDQGMHIVSLIALVWIAAPAANVEEIGTLGMQPDASLVALACGLIGVTFMGSILVFEFANTFGPLSHRRTILPYDAERVIGMLERGGALTAAVLAPAVLGVTHPLVPPAILVAFFVPRVIYALGRPLEERAYQMLFATTGLAVTSVGLAFVAATTLLTAN